MTLTEATILQLNNVLLEDYYDNDMINDFYEVDVYKICMDTSSGKRLYLAQTKPNTTWREAKSFEWVFNSKEGMEFDTKQEAEDFAKFLMDKVRYFKAFKNWYIYKTYSYR